MKIALGTDHAGFTHKEVVKAMLSEGGHEVIDFGTDSEEAVDYPDFVRPAAESVARGEADLGIVFGGSGNGEAMVANKIRGIRCALCWNLETARLAKQHNNANMLSIGARQVDQATVLDIVREWMNAGFEGGRHERRVANIESAL